MIPPDILDQIATMLAPRELMRLSRCSRALRARLAPLVPAARYASITTRMDGVYFDYRCTTNLRGVHNYFPRRPHGSRTRDGYINKYGDVHVSIWYHADMDMLGLVNLCAEDLRQGLGDCAKPDLRLRAVGCIVGDRVGEHFGCHVRLDEPPTRFPRIPEALCAEARMMLLKYPSLAAPRPAAARKSWCAVM
jgi:hypothetical protein